LAERDRTARLDLATLAICLAGFLGLTALVLDLKSGIRGAPRAMLLAFYAMVCAPFLTAFWRVPKPSFLAAPVAAMFLLYPIASPYGIVYGRDPIFNFAFTQDVVRTGFWQPGIPRGPADAYSLYPLGNVFMSWIILTASLPGEVAFLWIGPVLRLLVIPAAVYSIGLRTFGPRIACLGVFLYLGTASVLYGLPVQQGTGVIFFALALLSLLVLTQHPTAEDRRRSQILFAVVAAGIVLTHHLSSYIFAAWLAGVAVIVVNPRFRSAQSGVQLARLTLLAIYFIAILSLYIVVVSYRVYVVHQGGFQVVLQRLLTPESVPIGAGSTPGRTFSLLEITWLGGSVMSLIGLAWISTRFFRGSGPHAMASANALVGALLVLVTLPFIATGQEYLPLRSTEYANLFLAPFAAATLFRWSRPGPLRLPRFQPAALRSPSGVTIAGAILIASVVFMGGTLAQASMRTYFEEESDWSTNNALLYNSDWRRLAAWARAHYGVARVWGDHSAIDMFVGFAHMEVHYGSSVFFYAEEINRSHFQEGDTCIPSVSLLCIGDFVAVTHRMLDYPSQFFLEPEPPVRAPLTPQQVGKFADSPYFALIYQDPTFSTYRVVAKPS
jgi:hypothetical protein